MGAKPSCMDVEQPKVSLKLKASCCNKTIKIHIDDTEKIKALMQFIHDLSDSEQSSIPSETPA